MRLIMQPDYQSVSKWAAHYVAAKIKAAHPDVYKRQMYKCTPRSARISATVVMVIHTMVTKLNVDSGPTLSKWFFKGTEADVYKRQRLFSF